MSRRGSSLLVPVLVLLGASAVEFHEFFRASETIAAVAYEGAKAGALADRVSGTDLVARATESAHDTWAASELPGTFQVDVSVQDVGADRHIAVEAGVVIAPVFGFFEMSPFPITCVRVVKLEPRD